MYDQIILYDKTSTAENSFKWRSLFSQSNVLAVITFFSPSMQRISLIQDDKLENKQGKWEKKLPFEVIEIVRW